MSSKNSMESQLAKISLLNQRLSNIYLCCNFTHSNAKFEYIILGIEEPFGRVFAEAIHCTNRSIAITEINEANAIHLRCHFICDAPSNSAKLLRTLTEQATKQNSCPSERIFDHARQVFQYILPHCHVRTLATHRPPMAETIS
mmetsp:Transcript_46975/g.99829  ORF Transcript_46975/g.99829 Transcript_46975/m.99829 type:complete len:143 (+) Transcript_46975:1231-1659(+)